MLVPQNILEWGSAVFYYGTELFETNEKLLIGFMEETEMQGHLV